MIYAGASFLQISRKSYNKLQKITGGRILWKFYACIQRILGLFSSKLMKPNKNSTYCPLQKNYQISKISNFADLYHK